MAIFPYSCGNITCANKVGHSGPRDSVLCSVCDSYVMAAHQGWARRQAHQAEPGNPWSTAYAAIDALGALEEDNHATYLFYCALHYAACAQFNRTFGSVVKYLHGLFDVIPGLNRQTIFLGKEWAAQRKCRLWCGRKHPADCASACVTAREYLLDVYQIGSQVGLDHARKVIDSFAGMAGVCRCSAFNVLDDIMGLDPVSCAGVGQYTRKITDGVEAPIRARFEGWLQGWTNTHQSVGASHA